MKPVKTVYFLVILTLIICILTNSPISLYYAYTGLSLWYEKMIPSLLPFMILSGVMIRMRLTESFSTVLYPILYPAFKVSKNVCYAIIIGFFCGFPMGAKTVADLWEHDCITKREAEYLLCFCNNIGPVYFCSFALPLLNRKLVFPYLFGMYGIPLLYGILLRHTRFRDLPCHGENKISSTKATAKSLFAAIDESVVSSMQSILALCGYMVLFNLLNLVPHIFLGRIPTIMAPLFEITGGLSMMGTKYPLYGLLLLSFGGFSCIAQTYSCIRKTPLSIETYTLHKIVLTAFVALYYLAWFLLFPDSFLC